MTNTPNAIHTAEARLEVLTRINRAAQDMVAPVKPPYPQGEVLSREAILEQFEDRILDYKAGFLRVAPAGVAQAVATALAGETRAVVPQGLDLAWLPAELTLLRDSPRLSHAELDGIGTVITGAAVAISTTGTIILNHVAGQGRRALTLIPDRHICIVRASQVVQTVPEGMQAVASSVTAGQPLTLISGPSATSDIELVRVEGVHGPRQLSVIVVEGI